jgi:uracil phosphoribosyltransferase
MVGTVQNVFEIQHPLVQHHLVRLRDKQTAPAEFRSRVHRLSVLLTYEATKDLRVKPAEVETPLARAGGFELEQRIGLIPILRAGLGMVDAVLNLVPGAEVWHLGFYRDEKTLEPIEYYRKLPTAHPVDVALILDPMLATGGSAVAALQAVRQWGVPRIKLLALIAAPEGIRRVHAEFPDTQIYVCAVDTHLNERAYIVPGLGDAGDRIFNAQAG